MFVWIGEKSTCECVVLHVNTEKVNLLYNLSYLRKFLRNENMLLQNFFVWIDDLNATGWVNTFTFGMLQAVWFDWLCGWKITIINGNFEMCYVKNKYLKFLLEKQSTDERQGQ